MTSFSRHWVEVPFSFKLLFAHICSSPTSACYSHGKNAANYAFNMSQSCRYARTPPERRCRKLEVPFQYVSARQGGDFSDSHYTNVKSLTANLWLADIYRGGVHLQDDCVAMMLAELSLLQLCSLTRIRSSRKY